MPKRDIPDSESEGARDNSSSDEVEAATHCHPQGVSEYEKQRLSRIADNRGRLEAVGLSKMASSLKRSGYKVTYYNGKKKAGDDEEYVPDDAEARLSSSSREDELDDDGNDDEDFVSEKASLSKKRKVRKRSSKPKAGVSRKDLLNNSYHIDDDESLKQAIALSLQDPAEGSFFADKHVANAAHVDVKGKNHIEEDKGKMKNKKSFTSRLQMTEDEVIVHFYEIDETGKESVTMRDLQRFAAAHNFVWTDKELSDMIHCFDSDNDGKLTLDDFRKIIVRCNM